MRWRTVVLALMAGAGVAVVLLAVAPGGDDEPLRWVALGDSFSSGWGSGGRDGGAPCHRTDEAYARLAAGRIRADDDRRVDLKVHACSGARLADLGRQIATARLDESVDVVTVTIGGNDIDFVERARECANRACQVDRFEAELPALEDGLVDAYRRIRGAIAPDGRVLVLTYPAFFSRGSTATPADGLACAVFGPGVRADVRRMVDSLNASIVAAARQVPGVDSVDVRPAFEQRQLCDGPRAGWLITDLLVDPPLHPNEAGHRAMASAVLKALDAGA